MKTATQRLICQLNFQNYYLCKEIQKSFHVFSELLTVPSGTCRKRCCVQRRVHGLKLRFEKPQPLGSCIKRFYEVTDVYNSTFFLLFMFFFSFYPLTHPFILNMYKKSYNCIYMYYKCLYILYCIYTLMYIIHTYIYLTDL